MAEQVPKVTEIMAQKTETESVGRGENRDQSSPSSTFV
jgi:hypothetical protein